MLPLLQLLIQKGVALTGRNRTGPPCTVGRPTADAPGGRSDRPRAGTPARRQCYRRQTTTDDDDDRQTPTTVTSLAPLHYV